MKLVAKACLFCVIALVSSGGGPWRAHAQPLRSDPTHGSYAPSVADFMGMVQLRHVKLWFAGRSANWDLADYELNQIKASLQDAAALYAGMPATDVTALAQPIRDLQKALDAKDDTGFAESFKSLTTACNACHQAIGRAYIVIQVPTASPFSNQSFAPAARP